MPGLPHYVAQRGLCEDRSVFREPTDYRVFLHLLEESCDRHEVAIWGYTLLARSYSLILVPQDSQALDAAIRHLDCEFSHYHNLRHMVRGAVWKGIYRSTAMCWSQVWDAIAFAEREPVRQDRLGAAWAHVWSSAAGRVGRARSEPWLELSEWNRHWDGSRWMKRLQLTEGEDKFAHQMQLALRSGTTLGEMLSLQEPIKRLGPQRSASKGLRSVLAVS